MSAERLFPCPNCGAPVIVRLTWMGEYPSGRDVYSPVVKCACGEELQVMFGE